MMTFHHGTGGTPDAARAMAEYLTELPVESISITDYYLKGMLRAEEEGAAAVPRPDMSARMAALMGIDLSRTMRRDEVAGLLSGFRTDGGDIEGKRKAIKQPGRDNITYYDFTFSAPKSFSVAMALAPTTAERHVLVGIHRDAVQDAMKHLESVLGYTRRRVDGEIKAFAGELSFVSFDHYTARTAVEIPHTEADGTPSTIIQTVFNPRISADMQLHTHVITPNVVLTEDGVVGAMDTVALHDRVLEFGAVYQGFLAKRSRAAGIEVALDMTEEAARVTQVPQRINEKFSKRRAEGADAAKEFAKEIGVDWAALTPKQKIGILRYGAAKTRRAKDASSVNPSDFGRWRDEATRYGYTHETVIDHSRKNRISGPREDRLLNAFEVSRDLLDRQFQKEAVVNSAVARTAAAKALIGHDIDTPEDIQELTKLMREHGVKHDNQVVRLIWGMVPGDTDTDDVDARRTKYKLTTERHIEQEHRTIDLFAEAAKDTSMALSRAKLDKAIEWVSEKEGLDFSTNEHGMKQRQAIYSIGEGGRMSLVIGVAGAGKSTLLKPLVKAWTDEGRQVIGTANAWRQSSPLADAYIPEKKAMAIARLRVEINTGQIKLDKNTVIIVDELSQVGTKFALELAEWQKEYGFTLAALADELQGQPIDAGFSPGLMRMAMGTTPVPEIDTSVRQIRDRDKETALLFRRGKAAEGLERMRADGWTTLVPGGREEAMQAVADLWEQRIAANHENPKYKLTVSAATNMDARAISAIIRERRRGKNDLGPDQKIVEAIDQNRVKYDLPIAVGDRVRFYKKTYATMQVDGKTRTKSIGVNGSVLTIERIEADGMQVRNEAKVSGFVRWSSLADKATERLLLAYGDVITIDAIQSATSSEHITALVSGSQQVGGFAGYVSMSRARHASYVVVSDGLERVEIRSRRAQGNTDEIGVENVWENVARNLSRQPEKEMAVKLEQRAIRLYQGQLRSLAEAFQPRQQRATEGNHASNNAQARKDERDVAAAAPDLAEGVRKAADAASEAVKQLTGPDTRQAIRKAAREAFKATQQAQQRAERERREARARKEREMRKPLTVSEIETQFRDALLSAGYHPSGPLKMDGKSHRIHVEGDDLKRKTSMSGTYRVYLEGVTPAGFMHNYRNAETIRWKADRPTQPLSPEERAERQAKAVKDKEDSARRLLEAQAKTAQIARGIWRTASPATDHPYLAKKSIHAHGLRTNRNGDLVSAMQDIDGTIWGVQTIKSDGKKLFMSDSRIIGTHTILGEVKDDKSPLVFAEGFATGATAREITGLATVVAYNGSNLQPVIEAFRARYPDKPFVILADNDHHLPLKSPPLENVGIVKAAQAAAATGAVVITPELTKAELALPSDQRITDFNDLAKHRGLNSVRETVRLTFQERGLELGRWVPPVVNQEARDAARAAYRRTDTARRRDVNEGRQPPTREAPSSGL